MSRLIPIAAATVAARLAARDAVLIDIREADEFARRHIAGARSLPLSQLGATQLGAAPLAALAGQDVIFTCRAGQRTAANGARLEALLPAGTRAYVLEGGLDGWAAAGLPVAADARAPLEMNRQVMIAAGLLILASMVLGLVVAPLWFALAGFVGAGLTFAGISGFCGMARLLALAPWNRAPAH